LGDSSSVISIKGSGPIGNRYKWGIIPRNMVDYMSCCMTGVLFNVFFAWMFYVYGCKDFIVHYIDVLFDVLLLIHTSGISFLDTWLIIYLFV
jgi:hypothetical protein